MSISAGSRATPVSHLLETLDQERVHISSELDPGQRTRLGQFLTPALLARQLASMCVPLGGAARILDAGAGIGTLGAALVAHLLTRPDPPQEITVVAYEIDPHLHEALGRTLDDLGSACEEREVRFHSELCADDFLLAAAEGADGGLFVQPSLRYDVAILNPPYRKINTRSSERELSRRLGLESTNLYTAFVAGAAALLKPDGQLIAIVPRFANGTYFAPFRRWFTDRMVFRQVHVFESRSSAFSDDAVLQENVVFRAVKSTTSHPVVTITTSADPSDPYSSYREVAYSDFIGPDDTDRVIHILADEANQRIAERVASLPATLNDLGLTVSTGRVVDFRAREYLQDDPGA